MENAPNIAGRTADVERARLVVLADDLRRRRRTEAALARLRRLAGTETSLDALRRLAREAEDDERRERMGEAA